MREMFKSIGRGLIVHHRALLILLGGVAVLFVLVNGAFMAFSRYPRTCLICHYMEPYYAQWEESSHSEVGCVECHPLNPVFITVSTLRYLTGNYNPRPIADVPDKSCLGGGCHEERLVQGDALYKGSVRFDHAGHMDMPKRGMKLRCTSCHGQIVQGAHIATTEKVCFLCHFKGMADGTSLTGCTKCHGTPSEIVEHEGFSFSHDSYLKAGVECSECHLDVVEGDGGVPQEKCFECHVERVDRYSNLELVHRVHIADEGVDCFRCHEPINHGEIQMISALEVKCENCHEKLHTPQKEMYMGTGGRGVPDVPSRMFSAQVTCNGCHTHPIPEGAYEFGEESLEAEKASCVACHGEGYDHMVDDWIETIDGAASTIAGQLESTVAAARAGATEAKLDSLLEEAVYDYDFVIEGRGVHNVEYAVRLLKRTADLLDEARTILPARMDPVPRDRLLGTTDGYCTILCHNRIGIPESLAFERMEFPHAFHAEEMEINCTECHSPEKHKMRIITRSGCMDCHHAEGEMDCTTCHYRQHELYTGDVTEIGYEGDPDFMAQAEISCTDCHDTTDDRPPFEQAREACVMCHDESYEEYLGDWVNEGQRAAAELLLLESQLREALSNPSIRKKLGVEAQNTLDSATRMRTFLESAQPVHNSMLAQELLEESIARIKALLEVAGRETE